eukprot:COSAG05_NODE_6534_length_942_cov_1.344009_1_plen_219_part_00
MAAAAGAAQHSTAQEIEAFLTALTRVAGITDFIENLGRDLVASGVLRKAEFSETPTRLQLSKLRAKLKESRVYVGDISTTANWKDTAAKKDEWYDLHGGPLVVRIQKAWKSQAGGVGIVTDAVIRGQVLSKHETEEVVEDALMSQLEEGLAREDVAKCKTLIASKTRFGALFQRGWINFRESGVSEKEVADQSRQRLNSAFLAYSRLWTGKIIPDIFK